MSKLEVKAKSSKPELNKMGPLHVYETEHSIEIPEGFIGLLIPNDDIEREVTLAFSPKIVTNESLKDLVISFRQINPLFKQIYEPGDTIAQVILIRV